MRKPVCLMTGDVPKQGTKVEIETPFTAGGYTIVIVARDAESFSELQGKIEGARAYPCDVADLPMLVQTSAKV